MVDKKGKLFVISGPSGSGKSTLTRMAIEKIGAKLSVSTTTRPRSAQEVEGVDYYFISKIAFEDKIKAGEFLEYAQVFGNYYGTLAGPVEETLKTGQTVVLEIDVQGAAQVFENFPKAQGVLVLPPSDDELKRRLKSRGRDDAKSIRKRLAKAQWEIEQAITSGKYGYTVTNNDLENAVGQLIRILDGS